MGTISLTTTDLQGTSCFLFIINLINIYWSANCKIIIDVCNLTFFHLKLFKPLKPQCVQFPDTMCVFLLFLQEPEFMHKLDPDHYFIHYPKGQQNLPWVILTMWHRRRKCSSCDCKMCSIFLDGKGSSGSDGTQYSPPFKKNSMELCVQHCLVNSFHKEWFQSQCQTHLLPFLQWFTYI